MLLNRQSSTVGNPFAVLGLSPKASKEQIKEAFKAKALLVHPDTSSKDSSAADEEFRLLQDAKTAALEVFVEY